VSTLRRRAQDARRHIDLLLVATLSVLATVPFGRILTDYHFVVTVAGAAAIALVTIMALGRKALVVVVAAGSAGLALYLMLVVFAAGPSETWKGVTSTWSDLLTSTTPAVASPGNIAAPVLLGWAATMVGGLLALRTKPSAWPVVPPLLVLVVSLAFAGTQRPGSPLYPAAVVVVTLALLLARTQGRDGARKRDGRGVRSTVLVLGGSTLIAVALGTALPVGSAQSRYDLRAHYNPPLDLANQLTPLAQVTPSLQDTSTTPVFKVRFSGIPAGSSINMIPIAYLESYDGAVWGVSAPFSLAGPDLPPGSALHVPSATIHQTYQLSAFPSVFLPALEGAHSIGGVTLGYDRTTGTLVNPSGPGATLNYSVVSEVPQITAADIRAARPGIDQSVATLVLPPPNEQWPSEFTEFANQYGKGSTPLAKLDSLERELQSATAFGYNNRSRPGHSLGVLSEFLTSKQGDPYSRVGDSEQFAAAFAVLARIEGFPSRVVVGYRLPHRATAGDTQTISVVPSDMYAWTEVNLNGVGWVTFDPTNTKTRPPPPPEKTNPASVPVTTLPGPTSGGGGANNQTAKPKASHHSGTSGLVALIVVLVAVPGLILGAKKLRKRLRHERGTPADQIMGAWREARDRMSDRNVRIPPSATAREISVRCADADRPQLGDRIGAFGPLVDSALYSPEGPDEADVDSAWEAEAGVEDALKGGSDPASRLRGVLAAVNPRTLAGSIGRR
jgi:transglutaminase-like putative cysteine protease